MTAPDSTPPLARPGFDRCAEERSELTLVERAWTDAATRVLVLVGDTAPLAGPDALCWVAPEAAPHPEETAFLGRDEAGAALLAVALPADAVLPFDPPGGWGALRRIGGDLPAADAAAFVEALSLGRWLLDAPYCPACGARTELRNAGWSRRCPSCGREHFPRTDPAVIVAASEPGPEGRLLLGSNVMWGATRYSCFAGFVEAGESAEAAIHRELAEEAGVEVTGLRFRGSQAWPYPRSLMLGFHATVATPDSARPDGEEIVAVRWFTRAEIRDALAGHGDVQLPGPASIARSLIEEWCA